jgi:hypothetical protein
MYPKLVENIDNIILTYHFNYNILNFMKRKNIGIVLFLILLFVFSCKTEKNNINGKFDYDKNEQEIMEITELEQIKYIAGPVFGYAGDESKGWRIYKNINAKYSSEVIENEYFKTNSSIVKIYLYWILRERDWHNLSIIYNDLIKRNSEEILFFPGGCVGYTVKLKDIIDEKYNEMGYNEEEYSKLILPEIDFNN